MLKKIRRFASCFLAVCMVVAGGVHAPTFADTVDIENSPEFQDNSSHWSAPFFASLTTANIIDAQEFDPSEFDVPITRGRFTNLFARALGFDRDAAEASEVDTVFTDVQPGDDHYSPIRYAVNLGIVNGYPDNSFRPETPIERQEIFTVIGRAYEKSLLPYAPISANSPPSTEFTDYPSVSDYAKPYVSMLLANEIIVGYQDATIRPTNTITCAEAITIVDRIYRAKTDGRPDAENTERSPDNTVPVRFIPKAPDAPQPSPKAAPQPVVVATAAPGGGGGGSRGGGGGGSAYGGSQSSSDSVPGAKEPYKFDDSTTADIDSIASLTNILSINFAADYMSYEQTTQILTANAVCDNTESMKIVIDALRSLELWKNGPIVSERALGAFPLKLSAKYSDGASLDIYYQKYGLHIDGFYYPILWENEARRFERQLADALSRQNSAKTVDQIFHFFDQTDSPGNSDNSHKTHSLLNFQVGGLSADRDYISDQISLTSAALFDHDFGASSSEYGYWVYRFNNDFAYDGAGSFFGESLSRDDGYWLANLRERYYNSNRGVRIGKTEDGQWYSEVGVPSDDTILEAYEAINSFASSYEADSKVSSENIKNSPLGAAIDRLEGDVADARLVDIGDNSALVVYVRVDSHEFGYTLRVTPEIPELKVNCVYPMRYITESVNAAP